MGCVWPKPPSRPSPARMVRIGPACLRTSFATTRRENYKHDRRGQRRRRRGQQERGLGCKESVERQAGSSASDLSFLTCRIPSHGVRACACFFFLSFLIQAGLSLPSLSGEQFRHLRARVSACFQWAGAGPRRRVDSQPAAASQQAWACAPLRPPRPWRAPLCPRGHTTRVGPLRPNRPCPADTGARPCPVSAARSLAAKRATAAWVNPIHRSVPPVLQARRSLPPPRSSSPRDMDLVHPPREGGHLARRRSDLELASTFKRVVCRRREGAGDRRRRCNATGS